MSLNFGPSKQPLRPHRTHYYLGLDLGQRRDHSALVVLESKLELTGEFDHAHYIHLTETRLRVHHAERFPLGFPYLRLISILRDLFDQLPPSEKVLLIDAAGPGAPLTELIVRSDLDAEFVPITITPGSDAHGRNISRRALLSNLRILFEAGYLHLSPKHTDLLTELRTVQIDGHQSQHDDLVMALALAAWPARTLPDSESSGGKRNISRSIRNSPRGYP